MPESNVQMKAQIRSRLKHDFRAAEAHAFKLFSRKISNWVNTLSEAGIKVYQDPSSLAVTMIARKFMGSYHEDGPPALRAAGLSIGPVDWTGLEEKLAHFDWLFEFSDDHSVWKRGVATRTKLFDELLEAWKVCPEWAEQAFDRWAPAMYHRPAPIFERARREKEEASHERAAATGDDREGT